MHDAANMFEKAILPLDQSRCLEDLGYFGKAIRVLVDSANFDSALDCLKKVLSQNKSEVSWNNIIIFCVLVHMSVNPTIWELHFICSLHINFLIELYLILTNI